MAINLIPFLMINFRVNPWKGFPIFVAYLLVLLKDQRHWQLNMCLAQLVLLAQLTTVLRVSRMRLTI